MPELLPEGSSVSSALQMYTPTGHDGQTYDTQIGCCFFSFFLATLGGMWDLRSPTRDRTCALCSGSTEP